LGTDLDAATQARLDRGYRMVEILKQGQYEPLNVVDQVLIIFAGTRGHLDKIPVKEVAAWEKQFLTFMKDQKPEIRNKIEETKDLDEATMNAIAAAIGEFQQQYAGRKPTTAKV
jgi:F-type H+-transporting ATPase subunit alpha